MRLSLPWSFAVCVAGALQFVSMPAGAADSAIRAQCSNAYEQAQYLRKAHKLRATHEQLVTCLQADCPSYMSTDCQHWLTEVEAAQPSVVFAVHNESGDEVTAVKVSVDGEVVATSISGDSIPIDPGEHTFTFELDKGQVLTQKALIREGDKSHLIDVSMAPNKGGKKKANYTPAFAMVGVGVAGVAVGTIFGLITLNSKSTAVTAGCPHCTTQAGLDAATAANTYSIVSDVGFGVAILSAGLATYFFLSAGGSSSTPPAKTGSATSWMVAPTFSPTGGGLSLQGRLW